MEIAIILGSKSDWAVMESCANTLKEFNIEYDAKIFSAHRTPNELTAYLNDITENKHVKVIIAAAGLAAHLAGVIASHTIVPVIGVPMEAGALKGVDALYSMVQMPPGIPVGTVGIGKPGAINSALFAVSILSVSNNTLKEKIIEYRKKQAEKVLSQQI
ncbi:MAG: 5-(carboxyamino)imidazole ribonucleotide mutase [Leptospirales bacterium]